MFSIHPHIETHVPVEMHVASTAEHPNSTHAPTASAPRLTPSGGDFPSAGASGQASGLLGLLDSKLSAPDLTAVKLPGDAGRYVIKDPSNTRTPQPVYARSPETGNLKQTAKMGIYDGNGGVQPDRGLPGGNETDSLLGGKSKSKSLSNWNWGKSTAKHIGFGSKPSQSGIPYQRLDENGSAGYQQKNSNAMRPKMEGYGLLHSLL